MVDGWHSPSSNHVYGFPSVEQTIIYVYIFYFAFCFTNFTHTWRDILTHPWAFLFANNSIFLQFSLISWWDIWSFWKDVFPALLRSRSQFRFTIGFYFLTRTRECRMPKWLGLNFEFDFWVYEITREMPWGMEKVNLHNFFSLFFIFLGTYGFNREDVRVLQFLLRHSSHGRGTSGHGTKDLTVPHWCHQSNFKGTVHVCQTKEEVCQVDSWR